MRLFQRLIAAAGAAVLVVGPPPSFAAPRDAVPGKKGHWEIGLEDGACVASMTLQGGGTFRLRALDGGVTFALVSRTPLRRGKTVRIETEAYGFDRKASFTDDGASVSLDGDLDARAVAVLRLGREARILIDGRLIQTITLEGSGRALDGIVACSKGESGWWGRGVGATRAALAEPEPEPERELPLNRQGYWTVRASEQPGLCTAALKVDDGKGFVLTSNGEDLTFGLHDAAGFKRGRKGRVETDSYGFDFRPGYDGANYLYLASPLDSEAVFALRRTKDVKISVEGRVAADMRLAGTGHVQVLSDVAACARGKRGWWGRGAKQR